MLLVILSLFVSIGTGTAAFKYLPPEIIADQDFLVGLALCEASLVLAAIILSAGSSDPSASSDKGKQGSNSSSGSKAKSKTSQKKKNNKNSKKNKKKSAKKEEAKKEEAKKGKKTPSKKQNKNQSQKKKQSNIVESNDDDENSTNAIAAMYRKKESEEARLARRQAETQKLLDKAAAKARKDAARREQQRQEAKLRDAQAQRTQALNRAGASSSLAKIRVDPKYYGQIIGPGGSILKKLQEGTGARINIPKQDSGSQMIELMGDASQISHAKREITSIIEKGYSAVVNPELKVAELTLKERQMSTLIGHKGKTIKQLQDHFRIRINTPNRNSNSSKIQIMGDSSNVAAAKDAVIHLTKFGYCNVTHPGWTHSKISFPVASIGHLIGPGGHTMKSIMGNTKCKIEIPDRKSFVGNQVDVTITGTPEGVKKCIKAVVKIRDGDASSVRDTRERDNYRRGGYRETDPNDPNYSDGEGDYDDGYDDDGGRYDDGGDDYEGY